MELDWKKIREWLIVVCGGVVLYAALQNLGAVLKGLKFLLGVLAPLLTGCTIAFVLNVPMRAIERRLCAWIRVPRRAQRPLALVLTLLAVMGVLFLVSSVIAPGIEDAVHSVAEQLPAAFERLKETIRGFHGYLPYLAERIVSLEVDWTQISQKAVRLMQTWGKNLLTSGGGLVSSFIGGVATFVIGLVFAIYLLLQKEKLARQGRQVGYALLPERVADQTLEVLRLANQTFSSFLSGQCLEAVILGSMFVIAMSVLRFPYPLLVGVLIAVTALIPIVGAFIGCAVGAVLIALTDPWQALWFIVMFLILQQIEGNLIYPHVVGSSVGLPSIWVLAAVSVGGSLMGVLGMLLFIPLCSVLYALFRRLVKRRLQERQVQQEKWQDPPAS